MIQKALDSLPRGGKLFISAGEYLIDKTLNLKSEITVEGEFLATILKADASNINILQLVGSSSDYKLLTTIRNLKIDCDKDNTTDVKGIYCSYVWELRLENVVVVDASSHGIHLDHAYRCRLSGLFVVRSHGANLYMSTCGNNTVENSVFTGAEAQGILLYAGSAHNTISGCIAYQNDDRGLVISPDSCANAINGLCAVDNTQDGIWVRGNNNIVKGCIALANGQHGIYVTGSYNTIGENVCLNNGQTASDRDGIFIQDGKYNVVIGNECNDDQDTATQRYGIREYGSADYNIIVLNTCIGNNTGAILPIGANTIVRFNKGYLTENSGTATFSGDGSTTDFLIGDHGLAVTDPNKIVVKVTPISSDAIAASPCVGYVDPNDNTKIRVKFASAPASGTDNVKIIWEAQVVS